ncbi:hypothetical protein QR680_004904 [Steinernema hermaphroditum]|uniref:G-protein coupled receptors family 1 profile domain-containing protein n=1 Tax=Steinernema hermaphroditum TaxID=289476 RepID=A0AA39HQ79_9BILA|nr:hypothetical protein QR680_004904 [Steinernema hermaphroditum]
MSNMSESELSDAQNGLCVLTMGLSNIAIFAVFCPLNLAICLLICKNKSVRSLTAYKIILHITVVNIATLPSTLLLGIMNLTEKILTYPDVLITVCAAVSYLSPPLLCVMMAIQAFNRFLVISRFAESSRLFQALLWLSWALAAICGVEMVLRGVVFSYFEELHIYAIDNEDPESIIVFYASMLCLAVGALFFLVSLTNVVIMRGTTKRQDIYLLIQGLVPFLYLASLRVIQKFFHFSFLVEIVVYNAGIRSVPALNVLVYLCLNSTLRSAFFDLFRKKKVVHVVSISHIDFGDPDPDMCSKLMTYDELFPEGSDRVSPWPIAIPNLLISTVLAPLNVLILIAIFNDNKLWKFPAYRIIFHMTIAGVLSTISTFELGLIALLDRVVTFHPYFVAFGALIAYYGPMYLCLLSAVQAFNRFVVFVGFRSLTKVWIYQILIAFVWIFFILAAVVMILTGTVFSYVSNDYLYYYECEEPGRKILFYVSMAALGGGACLFLLSIASIIIQAIPFRAKKIDISLLIQGIIPFVYLALIRCLTTFPIPNRSSQLIIAISLAFRSMPAVYVIVYLTLNRTLRQAMGKLIRDRPSMAVSHIGSSL